MPRSGPQKATRAIWSVAGRTSPRWAVACFICRKFACSREQLRWPAMIRIFHRWEFVNVLPGRADSDIVGAAPVTATIAFASFRLSCLTPVPALPERSHRKRSRICNAAALPYRRNQFNVYLP